MAYQPLMTVQQKQAFEDENPNYAIQLRTLATEDAPILTLTGAIPSVAPYVQLAYYAGHQTNRNIEEIRLIGNFDLTGDKIRALLEVLDKSDDVHSLRLNGCALDAEGIRKLGNALTEHPSFRILSFVNMELHGCEEAICRLMRQVPGLKRLFLAGTEFPSDKVLAIASEVTKHPSLQELRLSCETAQSGTEGLKALVDAALVQNRRMTNVSVYGSGGEEEACVEAALQRHLSPNLLFLDTNRVPLAQQIIERNKQAVENAKAASDFVPLILAMRKNGASGLNEGLPDPVPLLYRVEARYPAITGEWEEKKRSDYEKIFRDGYLPPLPPLGGDGKQDVESLFASRRDHCNVAPLDNPRLFGSAEEARAFLGSLPWSPELLSRRTEQGSGVLDAALLRLPLKEVVREVNLKGLSIDRAALQERDGQPSQLFRLVETTHQGMALFSQANLAGQATGDVMWMRGKLPDYQRPGFVARHMAGTDRDTGMARGR